MAKVSGFPPAADLSARILVLGSMPGKRSLEEQQYYAQPRNAFWTIMGGLFQAGPEMPYLQRLDVLMRNGVALWDVLETCERSGSLDSSIDTATAEANDFARFFQRHRQINQIFFNGLTAAKIYLRQVQPTLSPETVAIPHQVLPSTSPAHAAMSLDEKAIKWAVVGQSIT